MFEGLACNYHFKYLHFFRFVGGEVNACYNAIDRHVLAGKGSKIALIHNSPVTKTVRKVTYKELLDKVSEQLLYVM